MAKATGRLPIQSTTRPMTAAQTSCGMQMKMLNVPISTPSLPLGITPASRA